MSTPANVFPTLRVGIAGGGNIFRNHLESYRVLPGVEVVALCDVDVARARSVAATYSVPKAFGSTRELLTWRDPVSGRGVDVLSVCTPHPTHEKVVTEAAMAGVHVLCEKPISTELGAAERMIRACRDAGVKFGVLFQRRFWPAAQQLRAAIDNGALGRPLFAHCSVLLHRDPEYYSATPWRGHWATDGGGALMTQGIHYIDLLQWYLGEAIEVHGHTDTFVHGEHMETEDTAVATLKFAGGALATLQASTAVTPSLGVQLRVTGATGATAQLTEFPEGTEGRLDLYAVGESINVTPTWPAGAEPTVDLGTINAALIPWHKAQVAQFVDAVRTGGEPTVTGEEATRSLRVLVGIYESARTGKTVSLRGAPPSLPSSAEIPQTGSRTTSGHQVGQTPHGHYQDTARRRGLS